MIWTNQVNFWGGVSICLGLVRRITGNLEEKPCNT
jgi:hypothetical protein